MTTTAFTNAANVSTITASYYYDFYNSNCYLRDSHNYCLKTTITTTSGTCTAITTSATVSTASNATIRQIVIISPATNTIITSTVSIQIPLVLLVLLSQCFVVVKCVACRLRDGRACPLSPSLSFLSLCLFLVDGHSGEEALSVSPSVFLSLIFSARLLLLQLSLLLCLPWGKERRRRRSVSDWSAQFRADPAVKRCRVVSASLSQNHKLPRKNKSASAGMERLHHCMIIRAKHWIKTTIIIWGQTACS